MLQDLEVVVGLDGVPNDRSQPLEGLPVGLEVASDLGLAVEVEGAPLGRLHDVLDTKALAVEVAIAGLGEAVAERCLGRRRRGGGGGGGGGDGGGRPQG